MKNKCMKVMAVITAAVTVSVATTGCGGDSKEASADNKELNIFVWTEYVPDSVIEAFTEETGIKVNVTTFSSNEDMLAKVKAESEGTYDLLQPSDYMVKQMADQGLLEEIDKEKLTNLSNIGEAYLNPSYDPDNTYSIPYQGGVGGIAVNTDKVDIEITSYADLFDESLKDSIVVLDDFRAVIGMTERSMGLSMNESDPETLSEVEEKLLTLKDNIKIYDSDSPKSALISGDCTVGFCWSAEIALAMEENPAIEVVYPEEGPYVFMDNWVIPKGAKHYDEALEFINYMLEAETAEAVSEEFPYLNPNTVAVEAMGSEYSDNEAKNPPEDVIASGEYVDNLDTDTLSIYDAMWTKLKE